MIVRAVGREGGEGLLTPDSVRVNRTYTTTDTPPTLITPTTATGRTTFTIELPDATDIDTGPVVYVLIETSGTLNSYCSFNDFLSFLYADSMPSLSFESPALSTGKNHLIRMLTTVL